MNWRLIKYGFRFQLLCATCRVSHLHMTSSYNTCLLLLSLSSVSTKIAMNSDSIEVLICLCRCIHRLVKVSRACLSFAAAKPVAEWRALPPHVLILANFWHPGTFTYVILEKRWICFNWILFVQCVFPWFLFIGLILCDKFKLLLESLKRWVFCT